MEREVGRTYDGQTGQRLPEHSNDAQQADGEQEATDRRTGKRQPRGAVPGGATVQTNGSGASTGDDQRQVQSLRPCVIHRTSKHAQTNTHTHTHNEA